MLPPIQHYLKSIQATHARGNATEHSYRSALESLLNAVAKDVRATNEPQQKHGNAPDFVVARNGIPCGHIETKAIGKNLDSAENQAQIQRYAQVSNNLIHTDYLTFRLLRDGETTPVCELEIAEIRGGEFHRLPQNYAQFADLLRIFCDFDGEHIKDAIDLAQRMARKAKLLAQSIAAALKSTADDTNLTDASESARDIRGQLKAFREHLIKDIGDSEFADVYAQTIVYGLFAARLHSQRNDQFSRHDAARLIPPNNPFLRKFFQHIANADLDRGICWLVDDLARLFRFTEVGEIMKHYGKKTASTDPYIHFYETFLGAYDPKKRKSRGVYYTPTAVVEFIVRSVDHILKQHFHLPHGIADSSKIAHTRADGSRETIHKVQILDPATGTGTFLAAIVRYIAETYYGGQKGAWDGYVKQHLIPRLNGFELLMASYAMAHLKLNMELRDSGCKLGRDRLKIFLTNTLEDRVPVMENFASKWFSDEAKEANKIKRDTPVMVVIGNPPYSGISSNMSEWITDRIEDYKYVDGKHFNERKHWLHDDYVKFLRYGQFLVDKTGYGVLAYINNHGFLDNPTFRGMRWHLLRSFDQIYIIDLHGNTRRKETAPDGSKDQNVFDIQQGVSINLLIKTGKNQDNELAQVFHHDIYGTRQSKYQFLNHNNLDQIEFQELAPESPYYFFVPKNYDLQNEYESGFQVTELFPVYVTGIVTMGDSFAIADTKQEIVARVNDFLNNSYSEGELKQRYSLGKNYAKWIIGNKPKIKDVESNVQPISYRPFDEKWTIYDNQLLWRWRDKVMRHFIAGENVGLITIRRSRSSEVWKEIFVTDALCAGATSISALDINYAFPLYLYPAESQDSIVAETARKPNLNPDLVKAIADKLDLAFTAEKHDDSNTFAPIDLLDYIYAVLHSPNYREKYAEFLKIDFPRVPFPENAPKFRKIAQIGAKLRQLHLMQSEKLSKTITQYNQTGDNRVTEITAEFTPEKAGKAEKAEKAENLGKVRINSTQYFGNVPQSAWEFYIGGYQPAQKYLKDRKNRTLTHDEIMHWQKIVVALVETEKLMGEIDGVMGIT